MHGQWRRERSGSGIPPGCVRGPSEKPSDIPAGEPVDIAELPDTKELEFTLEGQPEKAPSKLTESDQGYAFYLMEGFEFTPEEPRKDMIFHKNFPDYFVRVEKLPGDVNDDEIKVNAEEQLKANGEAAEGVTPRFYPMIESFVVTK